MSELYEMAELVLFAAVIVVVLILSLLAGREKVPEELTEEGLLGRLKEPFSKIAIYLWKRTHRRRGHGAGYKAGRPDTALPVAAISRIRTVVIFLVAGAVMGALVLVSDSGDGKVVDGNRIRREGYEGSGQDVSVKAVAADAGKTGAEQEDYGSYVVHVSPQQYTAEETETLAGKVQEVLPALLAGDNPDLQHVSSSLSFVSRVEGYPFTITWESEDYRLIDSTGSVMVDGLTGGETKETAVKATLRYKGRQYAFRYPVILTAAQTTEEDQASQIAGELKKSDLAQAEEEDLVLPEEIDGVKVIWQEEKENTALLIFLLVVGAGGINLILLNRQEQKKDERRRKDLEIAYPQIVSRMVLYLGAGMSVRNIFHRLGSDYETRKGKGKREVAGEEILKVCHELENGTSEAAAYGRFGQRCGVRSYIRLSALLVQNLRKGNQELLQVLQEEAAGAEEARKQLARQLGEEAGTKLLLPMMMMLAVTMIVIIVPAFLGFL